MPGVKEAMAYIFVRPLTINLRWMKHHYTVKLRSSTNQLAPKYVPSWNQFINDKSITITSFIPSIDNIFNEYHAAFWLTTEYSASGRTWSELEIESGLNRVYRAIINRYQLY